MPTEVKIAEFKSRLSQHLRSVRSGREIVVKDRDTPVARVLPYGAKPAAMVTRPPIRQLRDLRRLTGVKPRKLKPGDLDRALRETKNDWLDRWLSGKDT
jgi:antitoxin (DNA-binding transcriptional repressor) of toxin-antitoxin stability system